MKLTEKIAACSTAAVLFKFILAGFTIKWGAYSFDLGNIDSMTVAAILTPALGASHLETYVNNKKAIKDETGT